MKMSRILYLPLLLLVLGPAVAADPTRPPTPAEIRAWHANGMDRATQRNWQLQSILVSDVRRLAIIDGHRYQTGDTIAGARITSIEANRVVFEQHGERFSLTLQRPTPGVRRSTDDRG